MICPTPAVTLPPSRRNRRSADDGFHTEDRASLWPSSHYRKRRQAADGDTQRSRARLNDPDLQFHLGFILDGITTYVNMTAYDPQIYGQIEVYRNPEFDKFPEKDHIKAFRLYWPFDDNHILIQVGNWFTTITVMG